jgi:hypothetical protein
MEIFFALILFKINSAHIIQFIQPIFNCSQVVPATSASGFELHCSSGVNFTVVNSLILMLTDKSSISQ